MARRIANSTLNASTIDILNVIRQNASYDYQSSVPVVTKTSDIPKVGEIIYGTPAFANQFINALVNRIAFVRVQSATFNNPYARLKKGYIEYGETVEDIFVGIVKALDYSAEKAEAREMKRYLPDVRSAFHTMNWRVMYPVTIQDEDLRMAFLSVEGVQNLIGKIVDAVYTAAEYDEFLLFKYLLIKAVSHGQVAPMSVDTSKMSNTAVAFRGMSNTLPFMSNKYNHAGVQTTTPKNRQIIFMDANFNAQFDVEVLASAFNMGKADFMGSLYLMNDWTEFDNDRFSAIREQSDGIEEVTADELALMKDVKAVLLDENWFQIYDNNSKFTEKYIGAGMYWNYFYHNWKTISSSPFANAVAFVDTSADTELPEEITVHVDAKDESDVATVLTLSAQFDGSSLSPQNVEFVQTEQMSASLIAVQKYGAVIVPTDKASTKFTLVAKLGNKTYTSSEDTDATLAVDDTLTLLAD